MLIRIVKMEFQPEQVNDFLKHFEEIKELIRNFPGCHHLELYRDKNDDSIFFTYSKWEQDSDLENYRNSDLFKEVWAVTKPRFAKKAEAWSVDVVLGL
jgi:(4S)-4-hydroxy-5-phosphonooxypentane-2,3-dione isomerase